MHPKKFSEYTPTTQTTGSEIIPMVKNGANTVIRLRDIPVSTAMQAALEQAAGAGNAALAAHVGNTANPHQVTKAQVGLGNADNTSDANKPISTAAATALAGKQPLDSDLTAIAAIDPVNNDIVQRKAGAWINRTPTQFKVDLALVKADVGLGNADNTADVDKPVSTAQAAAIALKLNLAGGIIQPATNSTSTFQIKNADGSKTLFLADTTNAQVRFGGAGGDSSSIMNIGGEVIVGTYFGNLRMRATNTNKTIEFRKQDDTGASATINMDTGAASFAGLVTASTTPTAAGHLTPKSYVDAGDAAIIAQKGAANGIAPLGADSKIGAAYLPSYVDDVIEVANLAALPVTGETGKIYVTLDTNYEYRWGGSSYIRLVASPGSTDAVPEGSTNLYFTTARAAAAAPVQTVAGRTGSIVLTQADVANLTTDMAARVLIGGDIGGTPSVPLLKNVRKVVNVKDYGAIPDAITLTDVQMANGSAIATSASGGFANAVVGQYVHVQKAFASTTSPGVINTLRATIVSKQSNSQVTLSAVATADVSAAKTYFGTDNRTSVTNAINALHALGKGAALVFEGGTYMNSGRWPTAKSGTSWFGEAGSTKIIGGSSVDYIFATAYGNNTPVYNFYMEGIIFDVNYVDRASAGRLHYLNDSIFNKVSFLNANPGGWNLKMGVDNADFADKFCTNVKFIDCEFSGHSGSLEMMLLYNTSNVTFIRPTFRNNTDSGPCVGLWQKCFNTKFVDGLWQDNDGSGVYYSFSCAGLYFVNPTFRNSGGIAGANTSDYGAFGYTYVDDIKILNPTFEGGALTTTGSAIELGSVQNAVIINPTMSKYEIGISLKTRRNNIGGETNTGDITKNVTIINPNIRNMNPNNNFHVLHPGISIGDGTDYVTILGGNIYDDQTTTTQRYPIAFGGAYAYSNFTIRDVRLSAGAGGTSINLHDGATLGVNNNFIDNKDFTQSGGSPSNFITLSSFSKTGGTITPTTNSVTAVLVNQADGTTPVFDINTTNRRVGINTAAPDSTFHIPALGNSGVALVHFGDSTTNTSIIKLLVENAWSGNGANGFVVRRDAATIQFLVGGDGRISVGNIAAPTAFLHLRAGAAAASSAPLKLSTGTIMTTPEDGAIEYGSSHLYFTIGTTRYQLDQQTAAAGSVANSQLANVPANTIKGNNTGVAGVPLDMSAAATKTLLAITESDVANLVTDLAAKQPTITAGTTAQYYRGDKTMQTLDSTAVVEGTNLYFTNARADARITAARGVANGVASLDATGLVPASQLPSYVDDVVEAANLAAFPATGETGKIYVAIDTNKTYRWSGSTYVEISASPGSTDSVTEGSVNLYFSNERAQDAVGAILTDSASVDFTYDDAGNTISATVLAAGIDRNALGGAPTTVVNGGTGASTAANARVNLGVAIGSNVQAWDADLDALAALTGTGHLVRTGAGTIAARSIVAGSAAVTISNGDGVAGDTTIDLVPGSISHNALSNLTTGDPHTQYALLAGRAASQTLIGSTASGGSLTLLSTSHATKGKIFLGTAGVYDQVNDRIGLGTTSPSDAIVIDTGGLTRGIKFGDSQTIRGNFGHGEQLLGFPNKQFRWSGSDANTHFVIHNDTGWISVDRGANTATTGLEVNGGGRFIGSLTVGATGNPGAPTVTNQGAAGTTSYGYAIVANTLTGSSLASSTTTNANGNATLDSINFNRITWNKVNGATSYSIYRLTSAGSPATTGLIGTFDVRNSLTLQFDDTGLAGNGATPAAANTTGYTGINTLTPNSHFQNAGSTAPGAYTITGSALTLGHLHHTVEVTGAVNITLPAPTGITGREYIVINVTAASINVVSSVNIGNAAGSTTTFAIAAGASATFKSNGTLWRNY